MLAFALVALQLLPAPGSLAWEEVGAEADGVTYVNAASIAREGEMARFLMRLDSRPAQADGTARFVMRAHLDCAAGTLAFQTGDAYGAGDIFLRSRDEPIDRLSFEPVAGSSALVALQARVCGR